MDKVRLDKKLLQQGAASSRSQAENLVRMGLVSVNGKPATKPGLMVGTSDKIKLNSKEQYVSRAGFKLASVAKMLKLNFKNKTVLDVGSSTGGFTDYALQHGAKKVIAVDVGTKQMHPSLIGNPRIELHEQTDIRDFKTDQQIDIIVIDVSFISLREILFPLTKFMGPSTALVAMAKPQFEARKTGVKHKGVIKNDTMRRKVLKELESWITNMFVIWTKPTQKLAEAREMSSVFIC